MSQKSRGKESHEEGASSERWLLTYSDMITLLMVLFIVLFAMGQTDIRKFNAFKDSFKAIQQVSPNTPPGGPGVLSEPSAIALSEQNAFAKLTTQSANSASGRTLAGQEQSGRTSSGESDAGSQNSGQDQAGQQNAGETAAGEADQAAREAQSLANAERAMERALVKAGLAREVTLSMNQKGLVVTILTDKILFPLDSAQLQPEGVEIIDVLAPVLATLPNDIDVEGDTDNTPITGGPYASNWALSAARAVAVVETLINNHGIDPERLEATGNSDTQPVVPNNTPQHRAENRRVEIIVFSTTVNSP
jgi:chemotaxis protein MotB